MMERGLVGAARGSREPIRGGETGTSSGQQEREQLECK